MTSEPTDLAAADLRAEVDALREQNRLITMPVVRDLLDAIRRLVDAMRPPEVPDRQVREWRLYTGWEYGGVYCAEDDCGCLAEASEIIPGGWPADTEDESVAADEGRFTIAQLHEAVAGHIEHRAAIKAEEAEDQG